MLWKFGDRDFDIEEQELDQYLDDPAARGKVYFADGRLFLQAHLFSDVYTLYWPSIPGDITIVPLIGHVVQEVARTRKKEWSSDKEDRLSLSVLVSADLGLKERKEAFSIREPFSEHLLQQIEYFLKPLWDSSVSLYAMFTPLPDPGTFTKFSLWADTIKAPVEDKETGITTSIGSLPSYNTIELMAKTSIFFRETGTRPFQITSFAENRLIFLRG